MGARMFGNSDGKVIEMSGYLNETRFGSVRELRAYWEGLRPAGGLPKRSDIDPRGIENALEYAFILERIAPGLARLRIAGMHLNDLMGMEVRGMPISSFIPPAGRAGLAETLEAVTSRPATALLSLRSAQGIGRPAVEGRMLLLPLVSDFGDVSRVLGCFETSGQIGRAPRRFDIVQTELRGLDAPRLGATPEPVARPETRPTETRPAEPAGFAEPRADFEGKAQRRGSHLRLVKSDD